MNLQRNAVSGRCHICRISNATITYCAKCKHWFCAGCRGMYFARGIEFVKSLLGKTRPDCCGPIAPPKEEAA